MVADPTTASIREPMRAGQKPVTVKPSMNDAANQNRSALMTKVKSPSVNNVMGSVKTIKIGRTIAFNIPNTTAVIIAIYTLETSIPGI